MFINQYLLLLVFFNIFLALIPCALVYGMTRIYGQKSWAILNLPDRVGFALLFLLWFFVFPNTAYLFTMVRHLLNHCADYDPQLRVCMEESWMVMFFLLYALIGLPTFLYALRKMSALLGQLWNVKIRFYFPIVMIPLTALGVLFGLLDRLNSWDILLKPLTLLEIALTYIRDPSKALNFAVYTIVLYLIFYGMGPLLNRIVHDDSGACHHSGASSGRIF